MQPVRQLLRAYEQRFLERLASGAPPSALDTAAWGAAGGGAGSGAKRTAADFNRPVFAAAAFVLLGKARRVSQDLQWLVIIACVYTHAINHTILDI